MTLQRGPGDEAATPGAHDVTAIVLCGGRGRRMGGRDKPLLPYRGEPLIEHICGVLRGNVTAILISANRNLERYRQYGSVIEDQLPGHGPLAGMASCLAACRTPSTFICPGDGPLLHPSLLPRLIRALETSHARVAVAHDGRQRQNLHLLVQSGVGASLEAYLGTGGRSVKGWLDTLATVEVDCADIAASFIDLDEPDALPG